MPFICSICAEESTRICARCTKDACDNHLCEKCFRCSDCCECEVTLSDSGAARPLHSARSVLHPVEPEPDPKPEPPHPPPDPDPVPQEEPGTGM